MEPFSERSAMNADRDTGSRQLDRKQNRAACKPVRDREEKKPKPQSKRARARRETGFCLAECQDRELPLPHPARAARPRGDEPSRVVAWVAVTFSNGQRSPPTPTSEAHLGL